MVYLKPGEMMVLYQSVNFGEMNDTSAPRFTFEVTDDLAESNYTNVVIIEDNTSPNAKIFQ